MTLRFRGHLSESRKPNPANPLHRAMAKHGADKFKITLFRKDAQSYVELMKQEIEEIERRDAFRKGYNATYGGEIPPNALQLFVNGKTYPTLTSAANAHGLDPRMVNLRVQRLGWSVERALEIDHSIKEEKQVFVGGVRYSSLKRAAAILGQQYKTVHARVTRYGWTPEQALGVVPPPKESKSVPKAVIVDGMRFPSQPAAARHYGISPSLVTRRVRRSGLSLQEALTMPKTRKAAPDQKK